MLHIYTGYQRTSIFLVSSGFRVEKDIQHFIPLNFILDFISAGSGTTGHVHQVKQLILVSIWVLREIIVPQARLSHYCHSVFSARGAHAHRTVPRPCRAGDHYHI